MLSLAIVDAKIWSPDLLLGYLYQQFKQGLPSEINFMPEATCLKSAGVYDILDKFCLATGYSKSNITIVTANLLEYHSQYNVNRDVSGWYEIELIQQWAKTHKIDQRTVKYWFSNFTSRNHWARLWIATILNKYYSDKTLQTYNYFNSTENYNIDQYVGLDDLVKRNCDLISDAVTFLNTCPRTLDAITFPIQHPENLNLLKYYPDVFVDVVVETNVTGNSFLVTEKLWRPIIARKPFIVISNRHYLSNLKRLGFKTFNDFWPEEYDQTGTETRIKMIEAVLAKVSQIENPNETLDNMKEILDHNYLTFMNLTQRSIAEVFNA